MSEKTYLAASTQPLNPSPISHGKNLILLITKELIHYDIKRKSFGT